MLFRIRDWRWETWGECGFRQYISSKHRKYGIEGFVLVDAFIFYTGNMEMCGNAAWRFDTKLAKILQMLEREPISGLRRNVTFGNCLLVANYQQKCWQVTDWLLRIPFVKTNARFVWSFSVCGNEKRRRVRLGFRKMFVTLIHTW